ncbi:carboxypeptidase regulatory-like domain-containing protein [Bremerella sp. JC817]|uniref:carboxypeptidase regulatory-like domain-containing protein n=1 Tax=Bremerella sp. JC817 TaxID=3231756 RepID=UPI0034599B62
MKSVCIPLLFSLVVLLGCSSGKPDLDFGEVRGTVQLQGTPLPHATVRFQPSSGRPSYGKTNEAGEFTLKFMGREWGALVGDHQVAITTEDRIEDPTTGEARWQKEILPARYNTETTLTATVEPGDNVFQFELEEMKKGARR